MGNFGFKGAGSGGAGSITTGKQQVFEATDGQKVFVLTTITLIGLSQVYVNGIMQDYGVDKTTSTTQIEFDTGLNEGDIVTVTGVSV